MERVWQAEERAWEAQRNDPAPELRLEDLAARIDRLEQAIGKDAIGAGLDNLDYRLRRVVAKLSELVAEIQARQQEREPEE